jgi:hypothetical protein
MAAAAMISCEARDGPIGRNRLNRATMKTKQAMPSTRTKVPAIDTMRPAIVQRGEQRDLQDQHPH